MPNLRTLSVEGPVRSLSILRSLHTVEVLKLLSVRLEDLEVIAAMPRLRNLQLRLGSAESLDALASLVHLEYLEVWMVRGVTQIDVIGELPTLSEVFLQDLPRVTALPSLVNAACLRKVTFEHLRGLRDLSQLSGAPALRYLSLVNFRHLQPAELAPLRDSTTLEKVNIGLGSDKKNKAARDLLQIPGNYGGFSYPE